MKRSYLKVGDRSSAGGTVIEGITLMTHRGIQLTFVGAKVTCPSCKSTGQIVGKGPRWPGVLMGKQAALEGDVCACDCYPSPVMLASQTNMTMNFESHELAGMGFSPNGSSLAEKPISEYWIKFALNEKNNCEGLGCRAYFSDGSIEHGTFGTNNAVHFDRPNSSRCERVDILTDNERPSGSLIASLLSSMVG